LVLFACCRESYIPKVHIREANKKKKDGLEIQEAVEEPASRGANTKVSVGKVSNFTMVFGCDPAAGV
jgi:hypothetical protein